MMKKNNKSISALASLLCAVLTVVTLVVYTAYGCEYHYFDIVVFAMYVLATVSAVGYSVWEKKLSQVLNLLAVVFLSFGLGQFFLNSYEVWADRLNGIEMYGSRGTLFPVISITILMCLAILVEIVSCFCRKEKNA